MLTASKEVPMYHFKQSVCIPGKKGGRDAKGCCLPDEPNAVFKLGDKCEVPKTVSDHAYFKALVKDGKILEMAAEKPAAKPAPKPEAKKEEPKPKK